MDRKFWNAFARRVGLAILFLVGSALSAGLTVDDSLNRYFLFARRGLDLGPEAITSRFGWIGSDRRLQLAGDDSLQGPVVVKGDLFLGGAPDAFRSTVRVSGRIHGGSQSVDLLLTRNSFDSAVHLAGDIGLVGLGNVFHQPLFLDGHISTGNVVDSNLLNDSAFRAATNSVYADPAFLVGVRWGHTPQMNIPAAMPLPDTVILTRQGVNVKVLKPPSGSPAWTCGTNGGTNLVSLGICQTSADILPPGSYDSLVLAPGTTLKLGEGVYSFSSVILQGDPAATGRTQITAVQTRGGATIVLSQGDILVSGTSAGALVTQNHYLDSLKGGRFDGGLLMLYSEGDIRVGSNIQISATLVAPGTGHVVVVGDSVHLSGQILADSIRIGAAFTPLIRDVVGRPPRDVGNYQPFHRQQPTLRILKSVVAVEEGNGSYVYGDFPVKLDSKAWAPVALDGSIVHPTRDTLVDGVVYSPMLPTELSSRYALTIPVGSDSGVFRLLTNANKYKTRNRYFQVAIDTAWNAVLDTAGRRSGRFLLTMLVHEDDSLLGLAITPVTGPKSANDTNPLRILEHDTVNSFYLQLWDVPHDVPASGAVCNEQEIYWSNLPITADTISDFVPIHNRRNYFIRSGCLYSLVPLRILTHDNSIHQPDRRFRVRIDSTTGLDTAHVQKWKDVVIVDDDPAPRISIDSVTVVQPSRATDSVPVVFWIRLTDSARGMPTVNGMATRIPWKTVSGTALPGVDFRPDSGVLVVPQGADVGSVSVTVFGNPRFQLAKSFRVELGNPTDAVVRNGIGVASLVNSARKPILVVRSDTALRPRKGGGGSSLEFGVGLLDSATGSRFSSVGNLPIGVVAIGASGIPSLGAPRGLDTIPMGSDLVAIRMPLGVVDTEFPIRCFTLRVRPMDTSLVSTDSSLWSASGCILDSSGVEASFVDRPTIVREADTTLLLPVTLDRPSTSVSSFRIRLDSVLSSAGVHANFASIDTLVELPPLATRTEIGVSVRRDGLHRDTVVGVLHLEPVAANDRAGANPTLKIRLVDTDVFPRVRFLDSSISVREADTVLTIPLELDRRSGVVARGRVVATSSNARTGIHFEISGSFEFPPDSVHAVARFRIRHDGIYGPDRSVQLELVPDSTWRDLVADPKGSRESIAILQSDPPPGLAFVKDTLVVADTAGLAIVQFRLQGASDLPAKGNVAMVQGSSPKSISWRTDSIYSWSMAPGMATFAFPFSFGNDRRMGPDRFVHLALRGPMNASLGSDSILVVRILNTNRPPLVRIVSPDSGARLSQNGTRIEWTIDGVRKPALDTFLPEGPNWIRRCVSDTAGNVGCASRFVWVDIQPPRVGVFAITGRDPLDSSRRKVWLGDRARTRFSDDTVWYWVRDSIQGLDGKWRVRVDTHGIAVRPTREGISTWPIVSCDSAGNCGRDTATVEWVLHGPKVVIVSPATGAVVVSGSFPVAYSYDEAGKTFRVVDTEASVASGTQRVVRCRTDDLGNEGCDSVSIAIAQPHPTGGAYFDTDRDGRVDRVVVSFASAWRRSELPSVALSIGGADLRLGAGEFDSSVAHEPDSTRIVFRLASPLPFGWTGNGAAISARLVDGVDPLDGPSAFLVADRTAPVIITAKVSRDLSRQATDTLHLQVSEALSNGNHDDGLEVSVCRNGDGPCDETSRIWRTLAGRMEPDAQGHYHYAIASSDTGLVHVGSEIRFAGSVDDKFGNSAGASGAGWSTRVEGLVPLEFAWVLPEGNVPGVPRSERARTVPGDILLRVAGGDRRWVEPGDLAHPMDQQSVRRSCPVDNSCAGPLLEIVKPVQVKIHIYDQLGMFVAAKSFRLTEADLLSAPRDRFDRLAIQLRWNNRDEKGHLVAGGVYIWRIVVQEVDHPTERSINRLIRTGVRLED